MQYNLPIYDITIDANYLLGIDEIALVETPAIEELWVAMAAEEMVKLAADNDKQILTGPALIPDKLIYRIHPETKEEYYIRFSADVIRQIAKRFFEQQKTVNFLNIEHNKKNDVSGTILEAWVVEDTTIDKSALYGFKMPVGTWMLSVHIDDKNFWDEQVKKEKVKGFSIEGKLGMDLVQMAKEQKLVINPKSGETKDEFVSRCIAFEVGNGYDVDQATAMCYSKWDEGVNLNETEPKLSDFTLTEDEAEFLIKEILMARESYRDYPQAASDAAKRALKYKDENPNNTCGTRVGWARANQLANRRPISEETIARMASFQRHQQNKDVPYDEGCGGLMWDAWGGDEGVAWAQRKLRQIRREIGR